jgi:hypothetical protein
MIKEIQVSIEDITNSKPLDVCNCAIAKSLNRTFNINDAEVKCDIKEYKVDIYFIVNKIIYDKSKIINYDEVNSFITSFDMGYKQGCKPFQFGILI